MGREDNKSREGKVIKAGVGKIKIGKGNNKSWEGEIIRFGEGTIKVGKGIVKVGKKGLCNSLGTAKLYFKSI